MSHAATRQRIQAAALALFAEEGLAGASMAGIARRAGLSAAALYRYFPSKEALFDSLRRPDLERGARRTRERRAAVCAAAREVFGRRGFARATMAEVARAAGLSKAALYAYFPSKSDLFLAVLEEGGQCTFERCTNRRFKDPAAFLRAVGLLFLSDLARPEALDFVRMLLSESCSGSPVGPLLTERTIRPGARQIAERLAQFGLAPGPELEEAVAAFLGLLFAWAMTHRMLAPRPAASAPLRREEALLVDRVVDLFLHGARALRPNTNPNTQAS